MDFLLKNKFMHMVLKVNKLLFLIYCISIISCLKRPAEKSFVKIEVDSFPITRGESLDLTNVNGKISVESWDRDSLKILIRKKVYAHSQLEAETLYKKIETKKIKREDGIAIIPEFHIEHGEVEFHLFLPEESNLRISNLNGDVEIRGVNGAMDISTSNGDVTLSDVSGRIEVTAYNGEIQCSIMNLEYNSVSEFTTTNGDVIISIPGDSKFFIYGYTFNGEIESDFPICTKKEDIKNKEGAKIYARTANGNIKIKRQN